MRKDTLNSIVIINKHYRAPETQNNQLPIGSLHKYPIFQNKNRKHF